MSYIEQWSALAARISGLAYAAELQSRFLAVNSSDSAGVVKYLGGVCEECMKELELFAKEYRSSLPPRVIQLIEDTKNDSRRARIANAAREIVDAKAALVYVSTLRTEIEYLMSDRQEILRSRTERAMLHLQRLIAVDEREQTRWLEAFEQSGETKCEKYGAVHLLHHGIFAFKVNATGARTDLVYQQPVDSTTERRGIEGLVLTEWKIVNSTNALDQFSVARKQANLYAASALAGVELSRYRYLIAVSKSPIEPPADVTEGGTTYRHINVALEPLSPSVQARMQG